MSEDFGYGFDRGSVPENQTASQNQYLKNLLKLRDKRIKKLTKKISKQNKIIKKLKLIKKLNKKLTNLLLEN